MSESKPSNAKFYTPAEGSVLVKPPGEDWQRADGKPLTEYDRAIIAGEKPWDYWDRKDREEAAAKAAAEAAKAKADAENNHRGTKSAEDGLPK